MKKCNLNSLAIAIVLRSGSDNMFARKIIKQNEDICKLRNKIEEEVNSKLDAIIGDERNYKWECNDKSFKLTVSKHLDLELLQSIEANTGCELKKYLNDYAEFEYRETLL